MEGRRAEGSRLIRGCDDSSESTVVDSPSDEYTYDTSASDSERPEPHCHHPAVAGKALLVPNPLPPPPPPPEDPPPSRSYNPLGSVSFKHIHVEAGADIAALAADTRNQAAIVLLVICADAKQATALGKALSKASFGTATRGNGETGRSPPCEYQEKYLYAIHGSIVIAGRYGIVKDLRHHLAMDVPQRGTMLIAQLDYSIGIADALHMRVAAIAANSTVVERPEDAGPVE